MPTRRPGLRGVLCCSEFQRVASFDLATGFSTSEVVIASVSVASEERGGVCPT